MSYYVWGPSSPYNDYLQEKVFHDENLSGLNSINMQISRQTREIIASNEVLAQENFRLIKRRERGTGLKLGVSFFICLW